MAASLQPLPPCIVASLLSFERTLVIRFRTILMQENLVSRSLTQLHGQRACFPEVLFMGFGVRMLVYLARGHCRGSLCIQCVSSWWALKIEQVIMGKGESLPSWCLCSWSCVGIYPKRGLSPDFQGAKNNKRVRTVPWSLSHLRSFSPSWPVFAPWLFSHQGQRGAHGMKPGFLGLLPGALSQSFKPSLFFCDLPEAVLGLF